ncbi:MAG: hypothetical protein IJT70_07225 [Clostridia bacterium]|nr:hypothetical protein [Clostridia bacterium]
MKHRKPGFFKRRLLAIASAVIVLSLLTGVVSYAEFTKSNRAKRVIASVEAAGVLFSSNFMLYTEGDNTVPSNSKTLYTGNESQGVVTTVTICNFAQGNPAKVYDTDITYTLTAKLVYVENGTKRLATHDEIGDLSVILNYNSDTESTAFTLDSDHISKTFLSTALDSGSSATDTCRVEFSPGFNDENCKIRLYMIAVPTTARGDISMIDATFGTAVSHERQSISWEGYFNEAGARGVANASFPTAFDGFRYVITGTGEGTIKLSWKHALVHPNTLFLDEIGETPTVSGEWSYVDFSVDSDEISRYDTQFYYTNGIIANGQTGHEWDNVTGAVKCEYTES